MHTLSPLRLTALAVSVLLASCGGDDDPAPPAPEETRTQDTRTFTAAAPTLSALAVAAGDTIDVTTTSRWTGVHAGAAYAIEVPQNWNGKLVMYAHGYAGTGAALSVTIPSIRRHLVNSGYAWAASSYTKNYYDVRAGVEDTNALALEFNRIATANSRPLPAPTKTYIVGHSMGGHIAAAAIEDETFATANNKVRYHGAVPMCGVTGDTELFDYFGGYQLAAQALAGVPRYPIGNWADISTMVRTAMWSTFPTVGAGGIVPGVTTLQGDKLREVVKNLTGGERPIFSIGFAHPLQGTVWGTFGGDGTVNGILNRAAIDTNRFVYQLDNDPALSTDETALNNTIPKLTAAADFNRLRRDGLRWIPKVNGEFRVPVVAIHTLGDMYVPFKQTQIYRERAVAKGNGDRLVQRAIRAPSHCDFTVAEQVNAFVDMVNWESGITGRPAGDDVLTPATVAAAAYGCAHTTTPVAGVDSAATVATRAALPACPAP